MTVKSLRDFDCFSRRKKAQDPMFDFNFADFLPTLKLQFHAQINRNRTLT